MAEGELHRRLVLHLGDALATQGITVEAVDAQGRDRPEELRRWPWSSWFRPDVVGRRGRRRVYGDAKRDARDIGDCLGQLTVFAAMSRELVICVPEAELAPSARMLDEAWSLRHFGRLRLLGDETTKLHRVGDLV